MWYSAVRPKGMPNGEKYLSSLCEDWPLHFDAEVLGKALYVYGLIPLTAPGVRLQEVQGSCLNKETGGQHSTSHVVRILSLEGNPVFQEGPLRG